MSKQKDKTLLNCKWVIVCSSSSIDGDSNNISLSNLIDEITLTPIQPLPQNLDSKGIQAIPTPVDVVVLMEREKGIEGDISLPVSVDYIDPVGAVLLHMAGEVKMEPKHKRYRLRFKVNALPFTSPGEYKLQVISGEPEKTNGKDLCDTSLNVKLQGN